MNISQVIVRPVLTEKSVRGASDSNKYTFVVNQAATKVDVKSALKGLYDVDAIKVNILKGFPKFKWGKGREPIQKRGVVRKAIVTLKAGDKLDLSKLKTSSAKTSKPKKAAKTTK